MRVLPLILALLVTVSLLSIQVSAELQAMESPLFYEEVLLDEQPAAAEEETDGGSDIQPAALTVEEAEDALYDTAEPVDENESEDVTESDDTYAVDAPVATVSPLFIAEAPTEEAEGENEPSAAEPEGLMEAEEAQPQNGVEPSEQPPVTDGTGNTYEIDEESYKLQAEFHILDEHESITQTYNGNSNDIEVIFGTKYAITLSWEFPSSIVLQDGDTFTYQLPEAVLPFVTFSSGSLLKGNDTVGSYEVSAAGYITIIYSDIAALGGRADVSGNLSIDGVLNGEYGFQDREKTYAFTIHDRAFTVNLRSDGKVGDMTVEKAAPFEDSGDRYWVVVVHATGANTGVVIEDTMGDYLMLDGAPSIRYTSQTISYSAAELAAADDIWSEALDYSVYTGATLTQSEHGFKLRAGEMSAGTYYILYNFTFDYASAVQRIGLAAAEARRTNTVTVVSDQMEASVSADSSVSISKTWLSKRGVLVGEKRIEWTVVANTGSDASRWNISGYYFKDAPDDNQTYRAGTLKLDGVSLPDSDWDKIADGTYQFAAGLSSGSHTFTYQTTVTTSAAVVSNEAFIGPTADELVNSVEAEVSTAVDEYIVKSHSASDDLAGMLEWNFKLKNITGSFTSDPIIVTDTLPANMEYVEGSISVSNRLGTQSSIMNNLSSYVTAEVLGRDVSGCQIVRFTFLPAFLSIVSGWAPAPRNDNAQAVISYRTRILDQTAQTASYTNEAVADHAVWGAQSVSDTAVHTDSPFVNKSTEYSRQTAPYVNYTLYLNPESYDKDADDVTLTDSMGTGLDLVMGSIRVYEAGEISVAGGIVSDVTPSDDVELTGYTYNYDFDTRTLVISGLPADKALKVTYRAIVEVPYGSPLTSENAVSTVKVENIDGPGTEYTVILTGNALPPNGYSSGEENSVLLYKYSSTNNTIELSGAEFLLEELQLDSSDTVSGAEEKGVGITSDSGYLPMNDLLSDRVYRITETTAPDGYVLSDEAYYIVFQKDDDGWSDITLKNEDGEVVELDVVTGQTVNLRVPNDPFTGYDVMISKQDEDHREIAGASLSLTGEGAEAVEWISEAGESQLIRLMPGDYTLTEVAAPDGYDIAEPIDFTVTDDGRVLIDGDEVSTVVMVDKETPEAQFPIVIRKEDANGAELAGARLTVTGEDIEPIVWTTESGASRILWLAAGTYTLTELSAPSGYVLAESITFTVTAEGDVIVSENPVTSVVMIDEAEEKRDADEEEPEPEDPSEGDDETPPPSQDVEPTPPAEETGSAGRVSISPVMQSAVVRRPVSAPHTADPLDAALSAAIMAGAAIMLLTVLVLTGRKARE